MFLFFFGFFFSHGYFRWSVGYKQALSYVVGIEKKVITVKNIFMKSCGFHFIYGLYPPAYPSCYCGTD